MVQHQLQFDLIEPLCWAIEAELSYTTISCHSLGSMRSPEITQLCSLSLNSSLPSIYTSRQSVIKQQLPSINTNRLSVRKQQLPSINTSRQSVRKQQLASINTIMQFVLKQQLPSIYTSRQSVIKQQLPSINSVVRTKYLEYNIRTEQSRWHLTSSL